MNRCNPFESLFILDYEKKYFIEQSERILEDFQL